MRWVDFDNPEEEKSRLEEIVRKSPDSADAHKELLKVDEGLATNEVLEQDGMKIE